MIERRGTRTLAWNLKLGYAENGRNISRNLSEEQAQFLCQLLKKQPTSVSAMAKGVLTSQEVAEKFSKKYPDFKIDEKAVYRFRKNNEIKLEMEGALAGRERIKELAIERIK